MNDPAPLAGTPRAMLLATDLSARCDRALDRAALLAADWKAALTVLHVHEQRQVDLAAGHLEPSWRRPPDADAIARQRIRDALQSDVGDLLERVTVLVEEGEPADVIARTAADRGIDLLITGIARESPFSPQPVVLGRTVERLLRGPSPPLLIVRQRPRSAYRHVLVATDFSEPSGRAIQAALVYFPGQTLRILHAFEAPYARHMTDPAHLEQHFAGLHAEEIEKFITSLFMSAEDRRRLVPMVERGRPAELVRRYVQDQGADLLVIGTRGRGVLGELFLGSVAKRILADMPCDTLVVRS